MRIGRRLVSCAAAALVAIAGSAAANGNLVEAARNGDREAIRALLKERVDVNGRQADGATALAWAAHRDDLETADLLPRAGADTNVANEYGATPQWLACSNGSVVHAPQQRPETTTASARA